MKTQAIIIALCLSLPLISSAQAGGDTAAGKVKSGICASCHGTDGKGNIPLTGKSEDYLAQKLRDYKTRTLKNAMMNMLAAKLSDDDINNLAAYYSEKPK